VKGRFQEWIVRIHLSRITRCRHRITTWHRLNVVGRTVSVALVTCVGDCTSSLALTSIDECLGLPSKVKAAETAPAETGEG